MCRIDTRIVSWGNISISDDLLLDFIKLRQAVLTWRSAAAWLTSSPGVHEFHETCDSVTFHFMKKTYFLVVAGSAFYQIRLGTIFGMMHFLLIPENAFFHVIKCYRITSFMEFMCCVMPIDLLHSLIALLRHAWPLLITLNCLPISISMGLLTSLF